MQAVDDYKGYQVDLTWLGVVEIGLAIHSSNSIISIAKNEAARDLALGILIFTKK